MYFRFHLNVRSEYPFDCHRSQELGLKLLASEVVRGYGVL